MAATAVSPRQAPFDIGTLGAYPIRLGPSTEQQQQHHSSSTRYTGVQYNHKPTVANTKHAGTSIKPPESGSKLHTLRLKDGGDEYLYNGTNGVDEHTYILLPDEHGDGYTLERLDSSFHFNLYKTPRETNAKTLAQRYPQLPTTDDGGEGEVFGEDADDDAFQDTEADPDNPFDFRNHTQVTDSPSPQVLPTRSQAIGTPSSVASQASTRTSTPLARSVRKQPSAFALQEKRLKANPKPKPSKLALANRRPQQTKRVKLSPEPEQKQRPDANIPTVRLDRRASTRPTVPGKKHLEQRHVRNDTDELSLDFDDHDGETNHNDNDVDDDDGDLILEGDAPTSFRSQSQRSLGVGLSGALGGGRGPRSLLSAASSPASNVNSPRQPSQHFDTDGEEIDIDMGGGDEDDDEAITPANGNGGFDDEDDVDDGSLVLEDEDDRDDDDGSLVLEGDNDDDDNDDYAAGRADEDTYADEDVDEIQLPSPAQVHRPSVSSAVVTAAADDFDDLENQMLLALEGGDDDVAGTTAQQADAESEEESEEE